MKLDLFVSEVETGQRIPVQMEPMTEADAEQTRTTPRWQTDWTSDFIQDTDKLKYALKTTDGELTALGTYSVQRDYVTVEIVYIESHPASNPTMTARKKYNGLGKAMIAFGIALSVNHGCEGCVTFEAKTTGLARHYAEDFGAIALPAWGGPPRFMIDGEAAIAVISDFLTE